MVLASRCYWQLSPFSLTVPTSHVVLQQNNEPQSHEYSMISCLMHKNVIKDKYVSQHWAATATSEVYQEETQTSHLYGVKHVKWSSLDKDGLHLMNV